MLNTEHVWTAWQSSEAPLALYFLWGEEQQHLIWNCGPPEMLQPGLGEGALDFRENPPLFSAVRVHEMLRAAFFQPQGNVDRDVG